ncbi:hypothetical protein Bca52824_049404 [Brassica carinata]|uniref:LisH domain-containing protein n=1 Tax=Brassica carinata TaxID=52824 RepID=A0A8X7URS0_BRACI|nr:hypothetical protein Bca52824_049404 [Brassica carinata]
MARYSNRSKSGERIGKGKVTPVQVAYLVDRYLCDNRFLETRSLFRSEASSSYESGGEGANSRN